MIASDDIERRASKNETRGRAIERWKKREAIKNSTLEESESEDGNHENRKLRKERWFCAEYAPSS